jgi:hypothetical protein
LGFAAVQAIRAEISDVMAIGCLSQGQLRLTMTRIKTINLELDLPTLDEARRKVIAELRAAKREGVRVLKVIHGYGSTGKGGRLCVGLRKSFGLRRKEGVIREFIPGEDFEVFDQTTLKLLEEVPEMRGDCDLGRMNEGVTVVWIR